MTKAQVDSHYDFTNLKHYQLAMKNTPGFPYNIAVHRYTEKGSKKLFISIHGYLDNCGYSKDIHKFLFEKGYDVYCLDLPGHGLSSGKKSQIQNFNEYGEMFKVLDIENIRSRYESINFISHSTGTIAFVEALRSGQDLDFIDSTIFLTPLGRNRGWKTSMFLHTLVGSFITKIPRRSSSQERFKEIKETDPYYIDFTTTEWVGALKKWDKEIQEVGNIDQRKVYMFFGEKDNVVDNNYTKDLYQRLFPNSETFTIKDGSHHIDLDPKDISINLYSNLSKIL